MRIAIDAIKRLKQRDVAVQISMGCIKKGQKQDIEEVRQASIPKNGVCLAKLLPRGQMRPTAIVWSGAAGCGCGGGCHKAPAEVAVRYIVGDIIYPVAKNNQPRHRVRWK